MTPRPGHRPGHLGHQGDRRRRRPGGSLSIAEVALRPAVSGRAAAVEQDPEALFDSVVTAGRRALGAGRVFRSPPSRWPTRARPCWRGTATRAAADPGDRLAGPARRSRSAPHCRRHADDVARRTGLVLDPYFSAPEDGVDPGEPDPRRRGDDHRHLAGAPAVRRVRHRRLDRQPVAADSIWTRSRGTRSCSSLFGLAGEALPDIVGSDEIVGSTDVFGPTHSGRRADRRPAGRAAGRELPGARVGEVHLRHRRVPAGSAGRQPGAVDVGADHLGGVAAARARRPTASTVRSTRPPPRCGGPSTSGLVPAADQTRLCRSRFQRRRAVRSRARRAGGALVGFGGHRVVHRDDAVQRARAPGARTAGGHRRAGGRAGRPGRRRPGSAADPAAGGRRADPLGRADAGAGRPRPHPRRRLPVAARHRAGRRRVRAAGPRTRTSASPTRSATWTPQHTYEPTWSADRAAEFLARWRRAAESVLAQRETATP